MFESIGGLLVKAGLAEDVKKTDAAATMPDPAKATPAPNLGVVVGSSSEELAAAIIGNVKNALNGNTYFKLVESMDMMKAAKLNECDAAKGAAALMGASAMSVGGAIDEVVNAIKNEQALFEAGDYKVMVDNINALNGQASDLEAQIAALLEEVKAKSEQKAALLDTAAKATSDAQTVVATFNATVGKLVANHEAEKAKLTTYLA